MRSSDSMAGRGRECRSGQQRMSRGTAAFLADVSSGSSADVGGREAFGRLLVVDLAGPAMQNRYRRPDKPNNTGSCRERLAAGWTHSDVIALVAALAQPCSCASNFTIRLCTNRGSFQVHTQKVPRDSARTDMSHQALV